MKRMDRETDEWQARERAAAAFVPEAPPPPEAPLHPEKRSKKKVSTFRGFRGRNSQTSAGANQSGVSRGGLGLSGDENNITLG